MPGFTSFMDALTVIGLAASAAWLVQSMIKLATDRQESRETLWKYFGCASIATAGFLYLTWFQMFGA